MIATTTALGLLGWAAEGYAFHLLLTWMGSDIGLAKAVAIFTFATLAGGATGAPGGIGGAEAAMLALLALEGIPVETALPAKFSESITEAIGCEPERPVGFENLESLPQRYVVKDADVQAIKDYIDQQCEISA